MDERPGDPGASDEVRQGLTRRELIQRSAVVGGVLWAAPVIDSFTSSASAANVAGSQPPCYCGDPLSGNISPAFNGSTVTVSVNGFQGPCIGCKSNVLTYAWTVLTSQNINWGVKNQPTLVGTKTGSPAGAKLMVSVTGDCGNGTTCTVDPEKDIVFP